MTNGQTGGIPEALQIPAGTRRALTRLVLYLVMVGGGSIFIVDILSHAWTHRPWGIARHLVRGILGLLNLSPATFYYLPTGLFLGLAAMLLADTFKRVQGVILWLALVLSAVVLLGRGLLVGPLVQGFNLPAALFGGFGVGAGVVLGGLRRSRLGRAGDEREFPEAPRRLFLFVAIIVGYGVLEAILVYNSPVVGTGAGFSFQLPTVEGVILGEGTLVNVLFSGVGLFGLYKFTSYESHTKMLLIGPQRSGKSASFGGLQVAVRDLIDDRAGIKSNSEVTRLSDKIAMGEFPEATVREAPDPLEINYRTKGLFPEKMTLQSVDYAGELLPEILDPILGDRLRTDGGELAQEEEEETEDDDGPSLADIIGEEDEDEEFSTHEPAESWVEATERIYEVEREDAGAAIWDCVRHADRVIMTIPIDDFITPIVERGNWPSYQPIQTFDDDMTPEQIREEHDIPPEDELHSYRDGYYYYADEPDRADPADYLSWYRDLAREFRGDKEFILVGTMADWATEDFERENPRGLNPRIESNYEEFCRYVYEKVLLAENANIQDLMGATQDEQIYLLWYQIANTEPPAGDEDFRIDTSVASPVQDDHQTLLNGAKQLLERLNR